MSLCIAGEHTSTAFTLNLPLIGISTLTNNWCLNINTYLLSLCKPLLCTFLISVYEFPLLL